MASAGPRELHLTVPRTARYWTLGEPGPGLRQVWIACHGYGQLAGSLIRWLSPLASAERLVVAPEALSRFYLNPEAGRAAEPRIGASWMTREDREHEIADQVTYLDALHDRIFAEVPRERVMLVVFGFSQGAATVCRWLDRGRARADRLLLWGGFLPPDLELGRADLFLRATPLTIVMGDADEFVKPEAMDAAERALQAAKLPATVRRFPGRHRILPDVLRDVADEIAQ